jgi:hypothetical protein
MPTIGCSWIAGAHSNAVHAYTTLMQTRPHADEQLLVRWMMGALATTRPSHDRAPTYQHGAANTNTRTGKNKTTS